MHKKVWTALICGLGTASVAICASVLMHVLIDETTANAVSAVLGLAAGVVGATLWQLWNL